MKRAVVFFLSLTMILLSSGIGYASAAQPKKQQTKSAKSKQPKVVKYKYSRPTAGVRVKSLPQSRIRFTFKSKPYYFFEGVVYILVNNQYQVAELAEGMIIPSLPAEDLRQITIDNKIYYESRGVIYRMIETTEGRQYEVSGWL